MRHRWLGRRERARVCGVGGCERGLGPLRSIPAASLCPEASGAAGALARGVPFARSRETSGEDLAAAGVAAATSCYVGGSGSGGWGSGLWRRKGASAAAVALRCGKPSPGPGADPPRNPLGPSVQRQRRRRQRRWEQRRRREQRCCRKWSREPRRAVAAAAVAQRARKPLQPCFRAHGRRGRRYRCAER